jgi:hypothetical protein
MSILKKVQKVVDELKGKKQPKLEPTQQAKVLQMLSEFKHLKTIEVVMWGGKNGIGDASRRLRELREMGCVLDEKVEGKPYKIWCITAKGKATLKEYRTINLTEF